MKNGRVCFCCIKLLSVAAMNIEFYDAFIILRHRSLYLAIFHRSSSYLLSVHHPCVTLILCHHAPSFISLPLRSTLSMAKRRAQRSGRRWWRFAPNRRPRQQPGHAQSRTDGGERGPCLGCLGPSCPARDWRDGFRCSVRRATLGRSRPWTKSWRWPGPWAPAA